MDSLVRNKISKYNGTLQQLDKNEIFIHSKKDIPRYTRIIKEEIRLMDAQFIQLDKIYVVTYTIQRILCPIDPMRRNEYKWNKTIGSIIKINITRGLVTIIQIIINMVLIDIMTPENSNIDHLYNKNI